MIHFVKCPGNTVSVLYEQYTSDLNDLPAPKVSLTFIKGPSKWLKKLWQVLSSALQSECTPFS